MTPTILYYTESQGKKAVVKLVTVGLKF